MQVGLIQLSDIHIHSNSDWFFRNEGIFISTCVNALYECKKIVVIITGDITSSGTENEYDVAYAFLKRMETKIMEKMPSIETYQYVAVPGNHDCQIPDDDEVRNTLMEASLKRDTLESNSVRDQYLKPQIKFWEFFSKLTNEKYLPNVSYQISIPLTDDGQKICFYCYNSSLLSKKEETPGSLLIPTNFYINNNPTEKGIVISLFHHNTSWLSSKTPGNNKKLFETHLMRTSDIVMCGHEHSSSSNGITTLDRTECTIYLESGSLQNNETSEFAVIKYNTLTNYCENLQYKYDNKKNIYTNTNNGTDSAHFSIPRKKSGIMLCEKFSQQLNQVNIPIRHPMKEKLSLSDIFVYQDLEPLNDADEKCLKYKSSSNLATDISLGKIIFIEGETQSGKSALIKMIFQNFIDNNKYPILLSINDMQHFKREEDTKIVNNGIDKKDENKYFDIDRFCKKAYKEQYEYLKFSFDEYKQLENGRKVILIDDFDSTKLNSTGRSKLFETLLRYFGQIIVTISTRIDVNSLIIRSERDSNIKIYHLKSLGYVKRNELIEKWVRLGSDPYTCDNTDIERKVKNTFDEVSGFLGEQFIPPYPIFILSFLQVLNDALKDFDIKQTSYGFCYYSLIITALYRADVAHNKIEGIVKFLSGLAYELYWGNKKQFNTEDFEKYYNKHKGTYLVSFTCDQLIDILNKSYLLKKTNENEYSFSYKYIYYYLTSLQIADMKDTVAQANVITDLCKNLHKEREANILIFLVNHSNIINLIDNLLLTTMLPFEKCKAVTLNIGDLLFTLLNELVNDIRVEVMRNDVDPQKERKKLLEKSDELEQKKSNKESNLSEEDFESNPDLKDLNNALKVVRIVGQVIKNQRETLEKQTILSLIKESYLVSFRTVSFFTEMLANEKDAIIEYVKGKIDNKYPISSDKINCIITKLLQYMLYKVCLSVFSNLSLSVGASNMTREFDAIAEDIGSPAAKVISFTIDTYYNRLNLSKLENIVKEFHNNPVVLEIINARVINYNYQNKLDVSSRQRIGDICGLKLVNGTEYAKHNRNSGQWQ